VSDLAGWGDGDLDPCGLAHRGGEEKKEEGANTHPRTGSRPHAPKMLGEPVLSRPLHDIGLERNRQERERGKKKKKEKKVGRSAWDIPDPSRNERSCGCLHDQDLRGARVRHRKIGEKKKKKIRHKQPVLKGFKVTT